MKQWYLDEAVSIVKVLQPAVKVFGYHVAIGGSVVNNGSSEKDIDLYFLPMGGLDEKDATKPIDLLTWLESVWGTSKRIGKDYGKKRKSLGEIYNDINMPLRIPRPPEQRYQAIFNEAVPINALRENQFDVRQQRRGWEAIQVDPPRPIFENVPVPELHDARHVQVDAIIREREEAAMYFAATGPASSSSAVTPEETE